MDKLLQKLKDSFAAKAKPKFREEAWDNYLAYENKLDNPTPFPWAYLLSGLLLAALLFSNYWWVNQRSEGEKYVQKEIQIDTITHTQIVQQTDTVYITKYISQSITDNQTSLAQKQIFTNGSIQNTNPLSQSRQVEYYENAIKELNDKVVKLSEKINDNLKRNSNKTTLTSNDERALSLNTDLKRTTELKDETAINSNKLLARLSIDLLKMPSQRIFIFPYRPFISTQQKPQSFLEFITPKSLTIYGGVNVAYQNSDIIGKAAGASYSLGMTTLFSNHLRGRLGVNYQDLPTKSKTLITDPSFPMVTPPEGGVLEGIYLAQRNYQVNVGLEYLFHPSGAFRPFIGLDYNFGKGNFTDIKYEFETPNGETYIEAGNTQLQKMKFVGFGLGTDINIFTNLDAYIQIKYLASLSNGQSSTWTFGPGLYYHF